MFCKIWTVFCIAALALATLNSQNPEKYQHAVSFVDNYSYKAQPKAPRRLATTNWDSNNQRCYLNTDSNTTVQLTRLQNENNCKDFQFYHGNYFWDGASQSCFNYYYGTKDESYSPLQLECDSGRGILVAAILVPILSCCCLVQMCMACYKSDRCKDGECCCECIGRCCQSRNQNDEIQEMQAEQRKLKTLVSNLKKELNESKINATRQIEMQETERNLKTRVSTLEVELNQSKMNGQRKNEQRDEKLGEPESQNKISKANQRVNLQKKPIEQPDLLIKYQPKSYGQPLTDVKKYDYQSYVPQVLPPNQPLELKDINLSFLPQQIQEFEITFTNPIVEKVYKELGPFGYYDEVYEQTLGSREKRQKQRLKNGEYYTGEWLIESNTKEGRGIQIYRDGSVYEGYWRSNLRNGKGRYIYADGDSHTGYWRNDKYDGQGAYVFSDGRKNEAQCQDSKNHGFGVGTQPDVFKYQEDYVEGKKHGYGHQTQADKSEYQSDYINDDKHGRGIQTYSDGRTYEGSYKNDKMEGYGTFKQAVGRSQVGEYVNDKKEGDGIYTITTGKSKKGRRQNGKRVELL